MIPWIDIYPVNSIPANFFWDISVRFLSWERWDFWRRHDHFRRFPKRSEDFRRLRSLPKAKLLSPSLKTRINSSSLPVLFTSKIRDREEGIVIYSFYTWFSFLTWVWVTYFWKLCQARRQQLTFFNQAWEISQQAWAGVRSKFSTRRRESWQVYNRAIHLLNNYGYTIQRMQCLSGYYT